MCREISSYRASTVEWFFGQRRNSKRTGMETQEIKTKNTVAELISAEILLNLDHYA